MGRLHIQQPHIDHARAGVGCWRGGICKDNTAATQLRRFISQCSDPEHYTSQSERRVSRINVFHPAYRRPCARITRSQDALAGYQWRDERFAGLSATGHPLPAIASRNCASSSAGAYGGNHGRFTEQYSIRHCCANSGAIAMTNALPTDMVVGIQTIDRTDRV